MALLDITPLVPRPQVAYLFPELDPTKDLQKASTVTGGATAEGIFVFQFWPSQVQDSYEVEYASKMIPGGSNPLYQWVGGNGRTISFEATFTAEIDEGRAGDFQGGGTGGGGNAGLGATVLPSSRYTVDVAAAVNTLQHYQYPTYPEGGLKGNTKPPTKLRLVLPGTKLGHGTSRDDVLCFLKSSRVTYESWFPSGAIRVATVALEFVETVQRAGATSTSPSIEFIGTGSFGPDLLANYKYRGSLTGA